MCGGVGETVCQLHELAGWEGGVGGGGERSGRGRYGGDVGTLQGHERKVSRRFNARRNLLDDVLVSAGVLDGKRAIDGACIARRDRVDYP